MALIEAIGLQWRNEGAARNCYLQTANEPDVVIVSIEAKFCNTERRRRMLADVVQRLVSEHIQELLGAGKGAAVLRVEGLN